MPETPTCFQVAFEHGDRWICHPAKNKHSAIQRTKSEGQRTLNDANQPGRAANNRGFSFPKTRLASRSSKRQPCSIAATRTAPAR